VRPWPVPLATAVGFHKPRVRPPYQSDSCHRREQGGTLVSSRRESVRASAIAPLNRRPAVVGLAAPPYGLPSTDPTTPAPTVQRCWTVGPSSRCSSGSRWWSAHADNSRRSGIPPYTPFPSRQDRPPERPACLPPDELLHPTPIPVSQRLSEPQRCQ